MSNPRTAEPTDRRVLTALGLATLLASLGTSIANVALPTLAQAFHAPFEAVQWIVLAYLLAVTTLIVGVGRLGDIVGRRRLLCGGLLLFASASLACGAATGLWMLIAARAAQGLGAAVMMALTLAFVGEAVPKERTGAAMGVLGTTSAIGTALGPSLGGLLVAGLGWRSIFLAIAPLGLVALVLARRDLPPDRRDRSTPPPRFDAIGTVLLGLALGAYALAMTVGRGRFGATNAALLAAAVAGAVLFVWFEARAASPLVRLALVREPGLAAGLTMSALVATVAIATLIVGPFHLSRGLGLGAAHVGLVVAIGPLVAALTGAPAGRMVDRVGAARVTALGLAGMTAGAFAVASLPSRLGVAGYVAPMILLTAGYALFQTANNTAVMAGIPADRRGVVSGLLNLSRNLGLVTGASVMGAVFALASGTTDVATAAADAVIAGTRVTFTLAGLLVGAALVLAGRAVQDARWTSTPISPAASTRSASGALR